MILKGVIIFLGHKIFGSFTYDIHCNNHCLLVFVCIFFPKTMLITLENPADKAPNARHTSLN